MYKLSIQRGITHTLEIAALMPTRHSEGLLLFSNIAPLRGGGSGSSGAREDQQVFVTKPMISGTLKRIEEDFACRFRCARACADLHEVHQAAARTYSFAVLEKATD
ncbi:MAG: hypothetical protein ABI605_17340 [Rhizobacter sp.]